MKNLLLALVLLLTVSINAQDDAAFKAETIEFIKLTGATKAFEDAIDQIGNMVSQDNKEAYKKEATGTLDDLYSEMAGLYMGEFTRDEIKALVDFYKSDLGKKLASKQVALAQKGMMMGQSWGMKVQGIAQKYN
ncbi:DUF2059 domain-containing protein [Jejuia pallidilutea]|jgi:hypothetical protein|uniref:DUF2059 domain-containing protein n=1 Tax=Jejuia pallidilutea TaxID=504487 RepID=A0A090VKH6_9FLAO|nr:DUF2059 domain-containing protein [Jejuia pallidilutea]PQV49673.1 hypothetical protein CLV33_103311 [Jejuia pallidilutea]GAL65275.1 hypothetical protein JCM19301_3735 [Jejuia pallidilutea]GAL69332.1 hypothetical protein JCM19302_4061 [Jejuia pallidilutea]GAL89138.1 hypothetical protein JCM19538_2127 [Jejuia pallidilutea]